MKLSVPVVALAAALGACDERSLQPGGPPDAAPDGTLVRPDLAYDATVVHCVDLKAQGAVGDGVTDDTAALQKAVATAIAAGRDLCVPAGLYLVDARGGILLDGSVRLVGVGRSVSRFKAIPPKVTQAMTLFRVRAGASGWFEKVSFEGPDDASGGPWADAALAKQGLQTPDRLTTGVAHLGGDGGVLRLVDVASARFTHAFTVEPGGTQVEVRGSDVSALSTGMRLGKNDTLRAEATSFHDTGLPSGDANALRDNHLTLLGSAGANFYQCSFDRNAGFAIYFEGAPDTVSMGVQMNQCTFGASQNIAIRGHPLIETSVFDSTFHARQAFQIRNDMDLVNCKLDGADTQVVDIDDSMALIEGCTFSGPARAIQLTHASMDWTIQETKFTNAKEALVASGTGYVVHLLKDVHQQGGASLDLTGKGSVYGHRKDYPDAKTHLGPGVTWTEWP